MWSPRVLKNFFGIVLAVGVVLVGVHSCTNPTFTKTNLTTPIPRATFVNALNLIEVPLPRPVPAHILVMRTIDQVDAAVVAAHGSRAAMTIKQKAQIVKQSLASTKKHSAKKKSVTFTKKKIHDHKFMVLHHHKSKTHHHHHHHHHHGHSGSQKIHSHGSPTHLTFSPGCAR